MINFICDFEHECERLENDLCKHDELYSALFDAIDPMIKGSDFQQERGARRLADIVWDIIIAGNLNSYQTRFVHEIIIKPSAWSYFHRKEHLIRHFTDQLYCYFVDNCLDEGVVPPPPAYTDDCSADELLNIVRCIVEGYMKCDEVDVIAANIHQQIKWLSLK